MRIKICTLSIDNFPENLEDIYPEQLLEIDNTGNVVRPGFISSNKHRKYFTSKGLELETSTDIFNYQTDDKKIRCYVCYYKKNNATIISLIIDVIHLKETEKFIQQLY